MICTRDLHSASTAAPPLDPVLNAINWLKMMKRTAPRPTAQTAQASHSPQNSHIAMPQVFCFMFASHTSASMLDYPDTRVRDPSTLCHVAPEQLRP